MDPQYMDAIRRFEGFTPRAAWDYKQNSNGYGTRAQYPGEVIDRAEAERRLQTEVSNARAIVERFAPDVDEGTKAALTSLTFNAGDAWTRSGLGQAIQSGNMDEARRLFVQYNRAGGEINKGLVGRRGEEVGWMGGDRAPVGGPVYPTGDDAPFGTADIPKDWLTKFGDRGNREPAAGTRDVPARAPAIEDDAPPALMGPVAPRPINLDRLRQRASLRTLGTRRV